MSNKAKYFLIVCVLSALISIAYYCEFWNSPSIPLGISRRSRLNYTASDPFVQFCESDTINVLKAKCGYVFRTRRAGFGNQMFEYASFYGMAKDQSKNENGTKIAFTYEMKELEEAFDNLSLYRNDIKSSCMNGRIDVTIDERGCCVFDPVGQLPCDGKNYYIHGYRSNFKYFAHLEEEIRREYSNFKDPIKKKCDRLLKSIFRNRGLDRQNCMTVAVHLRRGDFVKKAPFHSPATVDYFKRAIKYFEDIFANKILVTPKLKHLVFVIFGDDPDWNTKAMEQVQISNPHATYLIPINDRNHRAVDMCAMSKCDHIIISTGTFGSWSAFLNPGIVTYQKEYAGSEIRNVTDDGFFLPNWIPL